MTILGIYCRAWEVDNPLSRIVQRSLEGWDQDGTLAPAPNRAQIVVRFDGARSTLRCVEAREMREQCLVHTTIDGTATVTPPGGSERVERLSIDVQHIQTPSVGCGGLSNGTAVAGWAASMRLLQRLAEIAGE